MQRKFVADGPDRLWCTDITEQPTRAGKVYCCATWDSPEQLGSAIFEWIEAWYDPRGRHTSLGMLAPAEYEQQHRTASAALHTAAELAA